MRVSDIFATIEGEAMFAGVPSVFVRTGICPFRCGYCDTGFRDKSTIPYRVMEPRIILSETGRIGPRIKDICLTGGEPLIEQDVVEFLNLAGLNGYRTHVETSGLTRIEPVMNRLDLAVSNKVHFIVDVKTPSAGCEVSNLTKEWRCLRDGLDCLKAVISDRSDYEFVRCCFSATKSVQVFLSPCEKDGNFPIAKDLANWILEDGLDVRMSIQLHKVIGVA